MASNSLKLVFASLLILLLIQRDIIVYVDSAQLSALTQSWEHFRSVILHTRHLGLWRRRIRWGFRRAVNRALLIAIIPRGPRGQGRHIRPFFSCAARGALGESTRAHLGPYRRTM